MATDPLQPVREYWKKKVHERDLREKKWPHDASEITERWLSAFLESEVDDFRTKPAGSSETTESVRMKVKHSSAKLQESRPSSVTLTFASGVEGVRRLWSKAYRNLVQFRREFSRLNPTSCEALGTSYDPQQPYHFCAVSEDLCSNEDLVSFGTWAEKGMNVRFAQLLYASAARTHGAFFANPRVEQHLRAGGGLVKGCRFSPATADVIAGFFLPSPQVDFLAGEQYRGQPLRTIYRFVVALHSLPCSCTLVFCVVPIPRCAALPWIDTWQRFFAHGGLTSLCRDACGAQCARSGPAATSPSIVQ